MSLHGACAHCHNHCECTCAAALLGPEHAGSLCPLTAPGSYAFSAPSSSKMSPEPWGQGCESASTHCPPQHSVRESVEEWSLPGNGERRALCPPHRLASWEAQPFSYIYLLALVVSQGRAWRHPRTVLVVGAAAAPTEFLIFGQCTRVSAGKKRDQAALGMGLPVSSSQETSCGPRCESCLLPAQKD